MDSLPTNPNAALVEAARAVAVRRLGRAKLPVRVVVALDDALEPEGVTVELVGVSAPEGRITDCLRDVIEVLARENKRLTTSKLAEALQRQGTPYGDTTLRLTLAQGVKDEIITTEANTKPPGYGLPRWPR